MQTIKVEQVAQKQGYGHALIRKLEKARVYPYLPLREVCDTCVCLRYFRVQRKGDEIVRSELTEFILVNLRYKISQLTNHLLNKI